MTVTSMPSRDASRVLYLNCPCPGSHTVSKFQISYKDLARRTYGDILARVSRAAPREPWCKARR